MGNKKAKVYIVGAGPGDPELITVKGLRAIKSADYVLHDFLSSPELLKHANKTCKKICVGKKDGLHLKDQAEINQLLFKKSKEGKTVVRLKGGDPFVFSRGFEEMRYLKKRNIDTEVIPGITSAIASPESFGIPLTVKDEIFSFGIVTGRKKNRNAKIDAPDCHTLVYLMAVSNIKNVVKALIKSGRKKSTPCAFIEKGTWPGSKIIYATLRDAEKSAKENKIKAPSVFIVGKSVRIGKNASF